MEPMTVIGIEDSVSHLRSIKGIIQPFKFNACSVNFLYNCAILTVALVIVVVLIFECKDYVKSILLWVEDQEHWFIYFLFLGLFTFVSFPFALGYSFLLVASGYLFGIVRGLPTVIVTANLGVFIAHSTMRYFSGYLLLSIFSTNNKINAVLTVISDPRAFKVAVCARLVPIPFGLQNTIFATSKINTKQYLAATFLGLLPAQMINVYLGSTLRSMEDVLSNKATAATGIIVLIQISAGVSLMMYIIMKARIELRKALDQNVLSSVTKPLCEV